MVMFYRLFSNSIINEIFNNIVASQTFFIAVQMLQHPSLLDTMKTGVKIM